MEVGIDRMSRFTYAGGDFIECERRRPGDDGHQVISITLQRWHRMKQNEDAIRSQLKELFAGNPVECRLHLGGLLFFQISSKYKNVQFRQYAIPAKGTRMYPTKFGISMSLPEYYYFVNLVDKFTDHIQAMKTLAPCYYEESHSQSCMECFPIKRDNSGVPGWVELETQFLGGT